MYLGKQFNVWWAYHDIPRKLRPAFAGKARFSVNLKTKSEDEAKRRAPIFEARWRAEISAMRCAEGSAREQDALFWRSVFVNAEAHEKDALISVIAQEAHEDIVIRSALQAGIIDESDPRYSSLPAHADAERFVAIATGQTVNLTHHLEEYLKTLRNEAKTIDMKRSTINKIAERFRFTGDITKKGVQKWVNEQAVTGKAVATIRRSLSEMRGYWAYLQSVQAVPEDAQPFDRLSLPKENSKTAAADDRQPFTPAEVVKLHTAAVAQKDQELADLIALAMFTGCRIEELCALPVGRVGEGFVEIADAKTAAGWRKVPIHTALAPTIARLIEQSADGYLLSGLSPNKYGDRSNAVGKRFGRLKKDLKFGTGHVFHSIRKTVSTMLENAGVPENVAADILGHEKPTMTYGLYSGGNSLTVLAAAIEKLAYPGFPPS